MRKQILTTLGVAALGVASYAATFMQVKTNDGKIVKFDVEDVTEVDFMTEEIIPQDTTPVIPSDTSSSIHSYVDLGLPSGTLWATYNIGATKPEEYGDYFAWGETEPKDVYNWSTYKWVDDEMTKYNDGDGLMTLLPEDDAATANWGSEWRMPTNEEQRELVEECQYQMTEVNGVYGAKFTGKNGNSVFFPAAGGYYGSHVCEVGDHGFSWSSSLHEEDEYSARYFYFYEKRVHLNDYSTRGDGFSVRAVRVQK